MALSALNVSRRQADDRSLSYFSKHSLKEQQVIQTDKFLYALAEKFYFFDILSERAVRNSEDNLQ